MCVYSYKLTSLFFLFQFSHMMDENVGSKVDSTGAEALANTDKAGKYSHMFHI